MSSALSSVLKTLRRPIGGGVLLLAAAASGQGILTVTPTRTTTTLAGNGTASSTTLAAPAAVAYDAAGNLYIADANNNVIRELVKSTGATVTIAGTGIAGFGGDGGAATSAQLDTPTGIAVDTTGNLYIADSHNQRIREVTNGTITTIAGTGTRGFSGDNAAATSAQLDLPSAVAVDAAGNVYIADTDNQRIRKITGTTITTIAGTGEQSYTGDNGAATSATLDSPTGIAVDAAGNVYIADSHNQRVREVSGGTITTIAGSGTPTFAGGFSGEGAAATAATLAKPTGVSVDAAGNVYIADTNNQRIRELGGGVIATVVGSGQQGFGADNGASNSAILNAPKAAAPDALGNLAVTDTLDQRVRSGTLPTLTLTSQAVGVAGTAQSVTVANTGTAPITVSTIQVAPGFVAAAGGTCPAAPITLAAGASCTQNVAAKPLAVGPYAGSVVFGGTGVVNQTVLLTGAGSQATTTVSVTSSIVAPFVTQAITFTAQVLAAGAGAPTGTVQFYADSVAIGSPVQITATGLAALTTSFSTANTYAITAVYSGDANFTGNVSAVLAQFVGAFSINPAPGSGGGSSFSLSVVPGGSAVYSFALAPVNGPFTLPISFSATGLPPGATAVFTPPSLVLGSTPATFTMTVQTAKTTALLRDLGGAAGGMTSLALLMLPFLSRKRKTAAWKSLLVVLFGISGVAAMGLLQGCGGGSGLLGQSPKAYTINVIASATSPSGAILQQTTQVTLTIE